MKLIHLYIENFGCLSGFELDFEQGITTINRPNGFGKTTLAEFIRAMFYGFPRKTKTLEKSKRQKYTPWNGGVFGGNLIFEHEGQCYRLERTFGATPKGDTFTLIDLATNRKSNRFSSEIGAELFGLDSDSFERSIYLPQMQDEDTGATASIQAKLSNLVEDSSNVGNFDKALFALKTRRSALMPYRGSGLGRKAETAKCLGGAGPRRIGSAAEAPCRNFGNAGCGHRPGKGLLAAAAICAASKPPSPDIGAAFCAPESLSQWPTDGRCDASGRNCLRTSGRK